MSLVKFNEQSADVSEFIPTVSLSICPKHNWFNPDGLRYDIVDSFVNSIDESEDIVGDSPHSAGSMIPLYLETDANSQFPRRADIFGESGDCSVKISEDPTRVVTSNYQYSVTLCPIEVLGNSLEETQMFVSLDDIHKALEEYSEKLQGFEGKKDETLINITDWEAGSSSHGLVMTEVPVSYWSCGLQVTATANMFVYVFVDDNVWKGSVWEDAEDGGSQALEGVETTQRLILGTQETALQESSRRVPAFSGIIVGNAYPKPPSRRSQRASTFSPESSAGNPTADHLRGTGFFIKRRETN